MGQVAIWVNGASSPQAQPCWVKGWRLSTGDLEVLHHAGIGRDPTAADPASSLPGPGPASVFWTAGQLLVFLPYVCTCRSLSLQVSARAWDWWEGDQVLT